MRVVLARPLSRSPTYDPEFQEPLGIGALAAVLRAAGHEVQLEDAMLAAEPESETCRRIASFRPAAVGLSVMSDAEIESCRLLVDGTRQALGGDVAFVAGGSFVSTEPEAASRLLPRDVHLIRHEGERSLLALLEMLAVRPPAPRLTAGQPQRSTCELLEGEWVEELDELPWAARDHAAAVLARCGVLNVQGSRGCTGSCTYCCAPGVPRPPGRRWMGRRPESVVAELARLADRHGAVAFNFVDDDFLGFASRAEDRALAFAEAIARRGLRIGFGAQLRPHSLTPGAISALAEAGLAWAFVGVESDDPVALREWHRPSGDGDAWGRIGLLRDHGVEVTVGAIPFHPGATIETIRRFTGALAEHGALNYRTATNRLRLLPGSRLHERHRRNGALPPGATGPFTPAIEHPGVEALFDDLVESLAPLRPCWVQAACRLPGLVSRHRAGRGRGHRLETARRVLGDMDAWTLRVLISLIERSGNGGVSPEYPGSCRATSRELALEACGVLESERLVSDAGQLRGAIELEAGG